MVSSVAEKNFSDWKFLGHSVHCLRVVPEEHKNKTSDEKGPAILLIHGLELLPPIGGITYQYLEINMKFTL